MTDALSVRFREGRPSGLVQLQPVNQTLPMPEQAHRSEISKEGLIQCARRHMKIMGAGRPKELPCECYALVRTQFKRVLIHAYE